MSASKKRPKPKPAPRSGQPRRTALITGITGQDGSYLAELLLAKGYEVVGVVRRTSHDSYERIGHLLDRVHIRSEEHTSELQSPCNLVCRLLLEKKKKIRDMNNYVYKGRI